MNKNIDSPPKATLFKKDSSDQLTAEKADSGAKPVISQNVVKDILFKVLIH